MRSARLRIAETHERVYTLSLRWQRAGAIPTRSWGPPQGVRRGGSGRPIAGWLSFTIQITTVARSRRRGASRRSNAYAEIVRRRRGSPAADRVNSQADVYPDFERQLADLERELRNAARAARERARAPPARRQPPTNTQPMRSSILDTDDTLGKILADARHELSERFSERAWIESARPSPADRSARLEATGGGRPGADA